MRRALKNGLVLLMMFSCSQAVIKEPQPVYVISTKFLSVAKGRKSFNYKGGVDQIGEWEKPPELVNWSELPENIIGFPLDIWLTKIKPVLKDLARKRRDEKD